MNNKFDNGDRGLGSSVTWRRVLKKFSVGPVGVVLACFGMGIVQSSPAYAQTNVPLIPLEALQDGDGGDIGAQVKLRAQGPGPLPLDRNTTNAAVVYADPSKITYPAIQPGVTIAGPAGPESGTGAGAAGGPPRQRSQSFGSSVNRTPAS
jgi:hypothetical protein